MRRRNRIFGCAAVCTGALIIFAMVLPSEVWWFVLGVALIILGLFSSCARPGGRF